MTDREMLELAAKAAEWQLCGYSWIGENEDDGECEILESAFVKTHPDQELATKWNPLTDDGDALRLADHLDLIVDFSRFAAIQADRFYLGHRDFAIGNNVNEAITRAAAQIGKEMK
mgnify:CR=1 FL=1